MKLIIKGFGILILLIGISLLLKPAFIFGWLQANMETTFLYVIAIGFRLVMGILFLLAAHQSKFPGVIKFIGWLAILAALIFLFMGQESFQSFFSTLIPEFNSYAPVSGLIGIVMGVFLIYAFSNKKVLEEEGS
jgi:hypothetical protein